MSPHQIFVREWAKSAGVPFPDRVPEEGTYAHAIEECLAVLVGVVNSLRRRLDEFEPSVGAGEVAEDPR